MKLYTKFQLRMLEQHITAGWLYRPPKYIAALGTKEVYLSYKDGKSPSKVIPFHSEVFPLSRGLSEKNNWRTVSS